MKALKISDRLVVEVRKDDGGDSFFRFVDTEREVEIDLSLEEYDTATAALEELE